MTRLKTVLAATLLGSLVLSCGRVTAPLTRSAVVGLFDVSPQAIEPPAVTEILSPNYDDRRGVPIDTIVLHHTATVADATGVARFFQQPSSKVSSHYVVDRSGAIVRCVADSNRAWHAGVSLFQGRTDVNTFSIGIEICNVGDNVEPYPPKQVDAVIHLMAWLAKQYNVPAANFTRHRDVAQPPGRKTDTSDNFDQNYVYQAVSELLAGRQPAPYQANVPPPGYDPGRQTYTVQSGDTWASISELLYDSPGMAAALQQSNRGLALQPGRVIKRPTQYL